MGIGVSNIPANCIEHQGGQCQVCGVCTSSGDAAWEDDGWASCQLVSERIELGKWDACSISRGLGVDG